MVRQKPQRYETSDGREFSTQEAAENHEKGHRLRAAYDDAKKRFEWWLAEQAQTADGESFSFDRWDYYVISPGWYGPPEVRRVSVSRWQRVEVNTEDNREITLHEETPDNTGGVKVVSHKISQLFASQRAE